MEVSAKGCLLEIIEFALAFLLAQFVKLVTGNEVLGWAALLLYVVPGVIIELVLKSHPIWLPVWPIGLPVYIVRTARLEAEWRRKTAQIELAQQDARITSIRDSSIALGSSTHERLRRASESLHRARYEYSADAYSPFWDAVEETLHQLASLQVTLHELTKQAEAYHRAVQETGRPFPDFPIRQQSLPDPTPIIRELSQVIRLGQTNINFAVIWEHRKTREMLIGGFRSLEDSVQSLADTIQTAMSEL